MQLMTGHRLLGWRRRVPRRLPYVTVEIILLTLLGWALARLVWTMMGTVAPLGVWPALTPTSAMTDPTLLTRFDPFFRSLGGTQSAAVTSLPLKLTGTRMDQAVGRGSAIITTPDGLQSSFAVGDQIVPGVVLKAVAFDNVTIERGGVSEQLYLDQSQPAQVATPGEPPPPGPVSGQSAKPFEPTTSAGSGSPIVGPPPSPIMQRPGMSGPTPGAPKPLNGAVSFAPRMQKGAITGFVVSPAGDGKAFAQTGLQSGDIVKQVNGLSIGSADEAAQAMANLPANGSVNLVVERSGKTVTVSTKAPR